jgi:hypothetical protein
VVGGVGAAGVGLMVGSTPFPRTVRPESGVTDAASCARAGGAVPDGAGCSSTGEAATTFGEGFLAGSGVGKIALPLP